MSWERVEVVISKHYSSSPRVMATERAAMHYWPTIVHAVDSCQYRVVAIQSKSKIRILLLLQLNFGMMKYEL